jgi:ribosomal protein S12 methylthiotransferase
MNVGVVSLGCAKNQVDTERMLGLLRRFGYEFTPDPREAEVLIVNTCGFIDPAKEESINTILEMAQYKERGRCKVLVATGCLTERYRQELTAELPEIDILLGVREYEKLPSLLAEKLGVPLPQMGCGLTDRVLTTPPYRAFLRTGDGCNNRCTYCAIPLIRGNLRSEPVEQLIDEAKGLADRGVTELTVIAQDTSGYGVDRYGKSMLVPLLRALNGIDGLHWVRVLYTYPDTVNEELLDTLGEGKKLIPYLDIPLQHIDDDILSRMHRRGSGAYIRSLLDYLYRKYPDFTLRTTMMVGFPGETDAQFQTLLAFLRDYPFDRVGAFAFSPEEGTKAAQMPDQVPDEVKQARLAALMAQQRPISLQRNRRWVGHRTELLIEELTRTHAIGRTPREAPDVDGQVSIPRRSYHAIGEYEPIVLTEAHEYDMKGESV